MSHRFFMGVGFVALVMVSGCMGKEEGINLAAVRGEKIKNSEQLLVAEGDWSLVEDEQAQDPMDMHSSARKQVNPNNRSSKQYVPQNKIASAAGGQGKDDVNFRLIRMQREMKGVNAESNIRLASAFDAAVPAMSDIDEDGMDEDQDRVQEGKDQMRAIIIPSRKPSAVHSAHRAVAEMQPEEQMQIAAAEENSVAAVISKLAPAAGIEGADALPQGSAESVVTGIRFGDYPEKTRMVLDLNAGADFRADVQNGRVLLELPKSAWSGEQHKVVSNPLVRSYTVSPAKSGGTVLSLELKKPVKLLGSAALPPNSQYGHRIYLDLAAS